MALAALLWSCFRRSGDPRRARACNLGKLFPGRIWSGGALFWPPHEFL